MYVKSKTWSDQTLLKSVKQTSEYLYLNKNNYLKKNNSKIYQISKSKYKNTYSNILIIDDTIATGITIRKVENYIKNRFPSSNIKLASLIIPEGFSHSNKIDYFVKEDTVPVIWEWGVELD